MDNNSWNPADLLQMSGGYWGACALHAGVRLNVFTPLAEAPRTSAELAGMVQVSIRGLGMLLDALSALHLLDKNGEAYSATAFSAEFLSRSSVKYLGHIILHHHYLMENWAHLHESVIRGGPAGGRVSHANDESVRESFLMGMYNLAMLLAPRIVPAIDLSGRRRLLDFGGGPATYAIQFCRHNPDLQAVVFDLPTTRPFAEKTIANFALSDRISFAPGDFIIDQVPGNFDVAWLSHVLHSEGPEGCATLLAKAVAALEPGGMLLIQEFLLNDSKDGPLFPALFSLNMLLGTPQGQSYSQGELSRMLEKAGAAEVRTLEIDLPNGAGIICGIKPD